MRSDGVWLLMVLPLTGVGAASAGAMSGGTTT